MVGVGMSMSGWVVVALAVVGWVGGGVGGWVRSGRRVAVGGGSFPVRGGVLSLFAGGSVPDLGVRVSAEWGLIGGGSRVGVHPRFIVGGGVGVCGGVGGGGVVRGRSRG